MSVKSGKDTVTVARFRAALQYYLEKTGHKRTDAAQLLGLPYGTITNILNGKSPSTGLMEELSDILGVDLLDMLAQGRDILAGEGPESPEDPEEVNVRGLSQDELDGYDFLQVRFRDDMRLFAGGGGAIEGTYDLSDSPVVVHRNALRLRSANAKNLIAFRVGGDSMEPTIMKNGLVIADTTQNRLDRVHDGDIYAFQYVDDGECAVKRLSLSKKGDMVIIESDNPSEKTVSEEAENIRLIGKIVWSWREH